LVDAFIRQYKFNMDVGPDRSSLQAMEKNNKESIREYTQRWRETAAQVNPSLLEKEMINLFVSTFKAPYFEYLVGSSAQYFSGLVAIAERIEQAICLGRIADSTKEKRFTREKKETEVYILKVITKVRERATKTKTSRDHLSWRWSYSATRPRLVYVWP